MTATGILTTTVFTALAFYAGLMTLYFIGWQRTKVFSRPGCYEPRTSVSVIIPARNEAGNIVACLARLAAQQYPLSLLEVIVIDDHSGDDTAALAESFTGLLNIKVIRLQDYVQNRINAYKKAALSIGIANSTGTLIITTDADCLAGSRWLADIVSVYEERGTQAVIAPVAFAPVKGVTGIFQSLDFMTMQGITAAVQYWRLGAMANGANFAFSRAAFEAVGGYGGTGHLASGDDYHLLQKLQYKYRQGITYLKSREAIVKTAPQPTWRAFLQQRARWASKSGKDGDLRLTVMLAIVYLLNLSLVLLSVAALFHPPLWQLAGVALLIKIAAEMAFLWPVSGFYQKRRELVVFPLLQPLHILYVVLAGFLGLWGQYSWKGRSVR